MKNVVYKSGILLLAFIFNLLTTKVGAQESESQDFFDMSLEELMNVQVTLASKKAESSFDSPLSTTVLTHEDLEKAGVTTIEEAFRLVPGMIVRQKTNGNYDIHIRGNDNVPPGGMTFYSENSMTLVMVNNRKVYNYANGGTFWESLPISVGDVERIEIVRGPSTALYGPNAVSGVINIVTKKNIEKPIEVNANATYGTNNAGIYGFSIASTQLDNKLNVRLSGNYEKRDRFDKEYYSWFLGDYSDDLYDFFGNLDSEKSAFYPNPELAKERKGLNGLVAYKVNDKIDFSIEGGLQDSYAQTIFMETQVTPIAGRTNESYYYNLISKLYGLDLQLSGNNGNMNIYEGSPSAKYDFNIFDASAEYNLELKNLTLRPGLSYSKAVYSDLPYGGIENGYLKGEKELSSYAYYLRGDYKPTEKLRLIAALRMDKYNVPDVGLLTYQLIGTYKLNDKNLIRAGFSRANRGSFMVDSYSKFSLYGGMINFQGGDNNDLATTDMIELGYRVKATNNISVDLELFQSTTKNISAIVADTSYIPYSLNYNFATIGMTSLQTGASANVNWVISPKYQVKLWATYVDAQLKDLPVKEPIVRNMYGQDVIIVTNTEKTVDIKNPQTPKFFGGVSLNASPLSKLNVFADVYYLGEHTYTHEFEYYAQVMRANPLFTGRGNTDVKAKATVDLKASYQVCKNAKIFVNARNLFNNDQPEFGFADKIGGLYLTGININL